MIDQQLIDSAKYIRRDFLKLTRGLDKYQEEVKELANFLLSKVEEIKNYNDTIIKKIKNKDDISKVTQHLLSEIGEIENREKIISDVIEKINIELEKIKNDELVLYNTIKERYPDIEEKEILRQIHSQLDE
jgi:predicted Rossmann fold nucleotide-binding protein DprA/Smf involved in DNA uptake